MEDYISLTIRVVFRNKQDLNALTKWLGIEHPSPKYQQFAMEMMSGIFNSVNFPQRDEDPIERFSFDIDHSENMQWDGESSELNQEKSGRWILGNACLKKGDKVWLRLGGYWMNGKIEYNKKQGYLLSVEPENVMITISEKLKMRWHI